jgi:hypothetical protein
VVVADVPVVTVAVTDVVALDAFDNEMEVVVAPIGVGVGVVVHAYE